MYVFICPTRYSIEDLVGDAKYMVNMKVEVCLEKDKPCILSQDIVKDLYLPKIGCDWSLDFSSKLLKLALYYFLETEYLSLAVCKKRIKYGNVKLYQIIRKLVFFLMSFIILCLEKMLYKIISNLSLFSIIVNIKRMMF